MSGLAYAYNTNGMAHHRLEDAFGLLADCGYDGVALTIDHQHLDPFGPDLPARTTTLRRALGRHGLRCVIETGARFLLDPRAKHEPTLVTADAAGRDRRRAFLRLAADIGADLGAEAVSFWAGVPAAELDRARAWHWLVDGVADVLEHAGRCGVTMALEPEPGMLVETTADAVALADEVGDGRLRLALDVGHCLVTGDEDPADAVRRHAGWLGTVSVDDMRRGVHEHRAFGEGDLDVPAVVGALHEVGWTGLTCIELSRDSHRADRLVPATIAALRSAEAAAPMGVAR
jgi:sugar phosphate isomerase/epimerase